MFVGWIRVRFRPFISFGFRRPPRRCSHLREVRTIQRISAIQYGTSLRLTSFSPPSSSTSYFYCRVPASADLSSSDTDESLGSPGGFPGTLRRRVSTMSSLFFAAIAMRSSKCSTACDTTWPACRCKLSTVKYLSCRESKKCVSIFDAILSTIPYTPLLKRINLSIGGCVCGRSTI